MDDQKYSDFSKFDPLTLAQKFFGFNGWKPNQEEIINRILNKEGDTLGIMPTGGGKSACFQIPALIQKNMTLVVTPIIALMKDQVDNLVKKGITSAAYLNSSMSDLERKKVISKVRQNEVKILYMAPETLQSETIKELISNSKIDLFVIDEAHCISTWGHDFRPDYLKLNEIINQLNRPQVLALTATATKEVEEDIQKQLGLKCKVFKSSFNRPSLYINVTKLENNVDKKSFLKDLLKKLNGSTIIYVTLTTTAEELAKFLSESGFKCTYYHGQMIRQAKESSQNQFISGKQEIIVATIAFGMGIDKKDIRNIIHFNCSQSIENYYQEIGRAGRDREHANCITLYTDHDTDKIRSLKERDWPDRGKLNDVINYLKNRASDYIFLDIKTSLKDACNISETPIKLILHRLEQFAAIKVYPKILYQIQISRPLLKSDSKIIESSGEYSKELTKILSSESFKRQDINFEEIMHETGINYFRIKEIFRFLQQRGDICITKETRKDLIIRNSRINEFDISPIADLFERILSKNIKKLDLLSGCLMSDECIRRQILAYFGERYEKDNCEMCSNCLFENLTSDITRQIDENYRASRKVSGAVRSLTPLDMIRERIRIMELGLDDESLSDEIREKEYRMLREEEKRLMKQTK